MILPQGATHTGKVTSMSDTIAIRNFDESDLDQLARIYVRAFKSASKESWSEPSARALVGYWLKRQPDLAFAAQANDVIVGGFIVGIKPWCDGNHLVEGELFVDPQFQGQGVGMTLLRHSLTVAMRNYAPVEWETYTFRGDDFPLSWYRRIGFEEVEEWVMIRAHMLSLKQGLRL
jgi:ribosomal protein S18 acetylase RimI-like enzyme